MALPSRVDKPSASTLLDSPEKQAVIVLAGLAMQSTLLSQ